jgi:hypothetical protein
MTHQVSHPHKKRNKIFACVAVLVPEIGDRETNALELNTFSELILVLTSS